jgi:hypothetical protein
MYSFATPPIKLKLGQQMDGGLLIANRLDKSLWCANQKHWAAVTSYLLYSFLQVSSTAVPFTSYRNLCNYVEPKPFSWAKLACIGFSSSNFTVQDHIPSTYKLLYAMITCLFFISTSDLDWFMVATVNHATLFSSSSSCFGVKLALGFISDAIHFQHLHAVNPDGLWLFLSCGEAGWRYFNCVGWLL